jgi:hypothetical protein
MMATARQAQHLLSKHGIVRPQPPSDWTGTFPLPATVEQFYQEVGPADIYIDSYGNSFFFPTLASLWTFQAGYRWNGLNGEAIIDWDDDWLVVADQGGDPFILSRLSGAVLHAEHGLGYWEAGELFPDLTTLAACLGQLGAVVTSAGKQFTDDDCCIRPIYRDEALTALKQLLGSSEDAEHVLESLGWG